MPITRLKSLATIAWIAWQAAACSGPAVRSAAPGEAKEAAAPREVAITNLQRGYLLDLSSGEVLDLGQDQRPLVLGREGELRLQGSTLISRRHLIIERHSGEVRVIDLSSTNGTTLNAAPLSSGRRRPLRQGDVLALATRVVPGALLRLDGPTARLATPTRCFATTTP